MQKYSRIDLRTHNHCVFYFNFRTKSNWQRNDPSPEKFVGSDTSGAYPGGSQSSKSFRGLSQHNEETIDWDWSRSLDRSKSAALEEPEPCRQHTPLHPLPLEDEANSSEEDNSNRKKRKPNPIDESPERSPKQNDAIDYNPSELQDAIVSEVVEPTEDQNAVRTKGVRSKKTRQTKPRSRKREIPIDPSPERIELEEHFYQQMAAAAGSITSCLQQNPKAKEKTSDEDAIINHFCKMQKHMLRTINSDARLNYIKECTEKLTQLCQLEPHII